MASYYWIKLYDEILDDPKMGRLSDGAFRLCINLFLLANKNDPRDGSLPDVEDIAWTLRLSNETAQQHLAELERAEIITVNNGDLVVTNFEKRQAAVTVNDRVKQFRERKRKEQFNDSETETEPEGNGSVTKGYTDIDKDKEKEYIYTPPTAFDTVAEFMAELSTVAKEAYASGFNEEKYESAAFALIGWDASLSDVAGFSEYWQKCGWHDGKPALTNIVNHWNDYKSGRDLRPKNQQQSIKQANDAAGGVYV